MRILYVLAILGLSVARTLEEWLLDPVIPVLDTFHLRAYIPEPTTLATPYAYSRFSLTSAITRLINALHASPVMEVQARPQVLDPAVLDQVTDKYRLGMVYLWSLGGIKRDIPRAYDMFASAALENQDADAMFMLGVFHATGMFFTEGEPNHAKAVLYYSLAANLGSIEAMMAMGYRHKHGVNAAQDYVAATSYYDEAAQIYVDLINNGLLDGHPLSDAELRGEVPSLKLRPVNRNSGAFGAETNTGLYGKHNYRVRMNPASLQLLSMGERSSALKAVHTRFVEMFETVEEAYDALIYRATDEYDPRYMYGLALISQYGANMSEVVDWDAVATFAEMCERTTYDDANYGVLYPACASLIGECYLWGEGRPKNLTIARHWFEKAVSMSLRLTGKNHCQFCATGVLLCKHLDPEMGPLQTEDLLFYEEKLLTTDGAVDANLAMEVARLHTERGELGPARRVLQMVQQRTDQREPRTMLQLAFLEEPLDPSILEMMGSSGPERESLTAQMKRPTSTKLDFFTRAFKIGESLLTPIDFAQYAYDMGDLESAVIAYAISSELGVTHAEINLADLFDVRHSYLGELLGHRWPALRALSEWPLPNFISRAVADGAVSRKALAVRYFGRAALHHSVDALSKLVEYGWYYGLVPAPLIEHYLSLLEQSNMALAHWWRGSLYYAAGQYQQALDTFSRVLVNPDAWMPAKFSQFLAALHLLRGDGDHRRNTSQSNDTTDSQPQTSWSHFFESYRGIIVVEDNSRLLKNISGAHHMELWMFMLTASVCVVGTIVHVLRRG